MWFDLVSLLFDVEINLLKFIFLTVLVHAPYVYFLLCMVQTSHNLNACCMYHMCACVCVYPYFCMLRGHSCVCMFTTQSHAIASVLQVFNNVHTVYFVLTTYRLRVP